MDSLHSTMGEETGWLEAWCAERADRVTPRRARVEIDAEFREMTDRRRRTCVLAMLYLCHERGCDSAAGFFGYQSPASVVLQALGGFKLRWTAREARWLAGYATRKDRGLEALPLYTIATNAMAQLDDADLEDSVEELRRLRVEVQRDWRVDGEGPRRASVQKLKRLMVRAGARTSAEGIPSYALSTWDEFGTAAQAAVRQVADEADAAAVLEVFGLYGTGTTPSRVWIDELGALGMPATVTKVARVLTQTIIDLDDNPDLMNPALFRLFLCPESAILGRAAAWALMLAQADNAVSLLHDVAIKCAGPLAGARGTQRSAGVANTAIAALGSLADGDLAVSARDCAGGPSREGWTPCHAEPSRPIPRRTDSVSTSRHSEMWVSRSRGAHKIGAGTRTLIRRQVHSRMTLVCERATCGMVGR